MLLQLVQGHVFSILWHNIVGPIPPSLIQYIIRVRHAGVLVRALHVAGVRATNGEAAITRQEPGSAHSHRHCYAFHLYINYHFMSEDSTDLKEQPQPVNMCKQARLGCISEWITPLSPPSEQRKILFQFCSQPLPLLQWEDQQNRAQAVPAEWGSSSSPRLCAEEFWWTSVLKMSSDIVGTNSQWPSGMLCCGHWVQEEFAGPVSTSVHEGFEHTLIGQLGTVPIPAQWQPCRLWVEKSWSGAPNETKKHWNEWGMSNSGSSALKEQCHFWAQAGASLTSGHAGGTSNLLLPAANKGKSRSTGTTCSRADLETAKALSFHFCLNKMQCGWWLWPAKSSRCPCDLLHKYLGFIIAATANVEGTKHDWMLISWALYQCWTWKVMGINCQ